MIRNTFHYSSFSFTTQVSARKFTYLRQNKGSDQNLEETRWIFQWYMVFSPEPPKEIKNYLALYEYCGGYSNPWVFSTPTITKSPKHHRFWSHPHGTSLSGPGEYKNMDENQITFSYYDQKIKPIEDFVVSVCGEKMCRKR